MTTTSSIPGQAVPVDRMAGHWLLAGLGKRVLRPGGRELTDRLLAALDVRSTDDVVELAPGMGATTRLVLESDPRSYVGIDRDDAAATRVAGLVQGPRRQVRQASASATGLPDGCADVVFGEAYLTMQSDAQKARILAELRRITRPGGRLGLHEICLRPDDVASATVEAVHRDLIDAIKVNARPLTTSGWVALLDEAGFDAVASSTNPLHLLEPRRLVADEGVLGAARFALNVARRPDARRRVLAMRSAMRRHADHLAACMVVAVRRDD